MNLRSSLQSIALAVFLASLNLSTVNAHAFAEPVVTNAQNGLMSLSDLLHDQRVGLDFEAAPVTEIALKQAQEYARYRKGGWSHAQVERWSAACQTSQPLVTDINPYCRIEEERALQGAGANRFIRKAVARERKALTAKLRRGEFEASAGYAYADLVAAVSALGSPSAVVLPLAVRAQKATTCLPESLTTALGGKLEEIFPESQAVDVASALYRQSVQCGKGLAMATAAFRLGLILVWQKKYTDVESLMRKVESVSEAQGLHSRAQYWRYQAAVTLGHETAGQDARDAILKEHPLTFHSLALYGNDAAVTNRWLGHDSQPVMMRSIWHPEINGLLRGAEALEKTGATNLAAEVLDRSVNEISAAEPEVRLYAAAFLHRIGCSLTKFKILSSLFQDHPKQLSSATLELMFPLSYVDLVRREQKDFDPLFFLALMRQESAFNPEAHSGVGARGLMQVMPATARLIRKVRKNQLFQPGVNIEVGTKYFMKGLGLYGGDVELTLAAYNAGFARVDQWLKRYPTENKVLFLDLIPFHETRDYVSSILRNYYWYTRLYNSTAAVGPGIDSERMQAILMANAGAAARSPLTTRLPATVGRGAD